MASACINNIGMSPESFIDYPPPKCPSYGWLSPRISFSRDEESSSKSTVNNKPQSENVDLVEKSDPEISGGLDFVDFEFPLEDPVMMLAADELFSDGKLVPLKLSTIRESFATVPATNDVAFSPKIHRRNEISPTDPYLFSPKAPSCSMIRWKEILRLKKLYQNRNAKQVEGENSLKTTSLSSSSSSSSTITNNNDTTTSNRNAARSLKHFLRRTPKSTIDSSSQLNLPLLNDLENESVSISSRLSLSSSSSGHSHDDLPRLSLDSDKPNNTITRNNTHHQINTNTNTNTTSNLNRLVRAAKHRSPRQPPESPTPAAISVSAESPRMNSSGKIVFHSLERSSSSPSTFNSGPRYKHRGIERSYSANVRFTPVLNVPVCSGVFGRTLFSSQQKKEINGGTTNRSVQQSHVKNRMDRT